MGYSCRDPGSWALVHSKPDPREKQGRSCTALLGREGDDEQCLSNHNKIPRVQKEQGLGIKARAALIKYLLGFGDLCAPTRRIHIK